MSLGVRKILYLVLGSGAFLSAFLALVGAVATIGATFDRWAEMDFVSAAGMLLTFSVFVGGLLGLAAAIRTIRVLPDVTPRQRVFLSCGLVAGIIPAALFSIATWGDSDGEATFYLLTMPAFVGLALLTELWLPYLRLNRSFIVRKPSFSNHESP